ncbi:hypothetical protein [Paenibacillus castaneae]|nr:hypothetical protein [Paenibacillus castaneae]
MIKVIIPTVYDKAMLSQHGFVVRRGPTKDRTAVLMQDWLR